VTIAIRPLHRGGMRKANHIFPKNGSRIFFAAGLDARINFERRRESSNASGDRRRLSPGASRLQSSPSATRALP
jgi:hypothetical protein